MDKSNRPIGIFDSGVGGISVLRELIHLMPQEDYIYFGDNKNAPYGVKREDEILALTKRAVYGLLDQNIKALVIACNTATSAAGKALREALDVPVVGMEPALKPAYLSGNDGKILVMATPSTLRQEKFRLLMEKYGENAIPVPCKGLADFVERGDRGSCELTAYLDALFEPYKDKEIGCVVLGCTHYVFVKDAVARALPGVEQFDGNLGTAHQLRALLEADGALKRTGSGRVMLNTSGEEARYLPLMRALLYE